MLNYFKIFCMVNLFQCHILKCMLTSWSLWGIIPLVALQTEVKCLAVKASVVEECSEIIKIQNVVFTVVTLIPVNGIIYLLARD